MKVWENSKKLWKQLPAAHVPTAFLILPNFHLCFYNSIETRYNCFLFLNYRICLHFLSCFMHDVTNCTLQLLIWSKIKGLCQHPLWTQKWHEALGFILSHITWWNNFVAIKINEAVAKRIWKASKIKYLVHYE